jgi:hypothetical protein
MVSLQLTLQMLHAAILSDLTSKEYIEDSNLAETIKPIS